jgi:hypothetical protein
MEAEAIKLPIINMSTSAHLFGLAWLYRSYAMLPKIAHNIWLAAQETTTSETRVTPSRRL